MTGPRIAYFANQFADAKGHGLARYARELHAALVARGEVEVVPVAGWTSLPEADFARLRQQTGLRLTGLGRRLTPLAWTFAGMPTIERLLGGGIDVVHAVSLGYPVATRHPLIVTVHDLGPLTHPHFFHNTRPWVMRRSLAQAERQAEVIVCVSQSTADEVESVLGAGIRPRLRVIGEGVSPDFFNPAPSGCLTGLDLPPEGTPFILSAGKISPRKNVQGVIRALGRIRGDIPHHLVLVGGDGWDVEIVSEEIAAAGLEARVHLAGFVSDLQLRALYQRAALYVHPSFYEGFGLTVLEAMAAGTPVIAANGSSLPEVAGTAGRLVDPGDTDALATAMAEIGTDAGLARRMREAGRAHALTFGWDNVAARMAELYVELAGGRSGRTCI